MGWWVPWVVGTAVAIGAGLLGGVFLSALLFGLRDATFTPEGRLTLALFWGMVYWVPLVASSVWQGWWGRQFLSPWGWVGATGGGGMLGIVALVGVAQMFDFGDQYNRRIGDFLGISAPFCLWVGATVGQGLYLRWRLGDWGSVGAWLRMTLGAMAVWGGVTRLVKLGGGGLLVPLLLTGVTYGLGGGLGLSPLLPRLRR